MDHVLVSRLYFAYGSNMSSPRLRARIEGVELLGAARLVDWQLVFNKPSLDGSGKANLRAAPGHTVWGVVWRLEEQAWYALDGFEPGYARELCEVVDRSELRHRSQIYLHPAMGPEILPYDWYLAHLVEGALEHGLPDDYVEQLRRVRSRRGELRR